MDRRNGRRPIPVRLAVLAPAVALVAQLGCGPGGVSLENQDVREEIAKNFPDWSLVTTRDLTQDDLDAWSARHPDAAPGFATGDYFGDGRDAYAALITTEDATLGKRVRLIVLERTESGRFVTYSLFTESPVEELPAIFTSRAGEYQVFIEERAVPVPVEGVVYTHPGESQKLFFWTGSNFQDVELGVEG